MSATHGGNALLSREAVREQLDSVNFKVGGEVPLAAAHFARIARSDADDMLNEAVRRALASRNCPAHVDMEQFLNGILRSLASGLNRARLIMQRDDYMPLPDLLASVGLASMTSPPADEVLEIERQREFFASLLDELASHSDAMARLIDAIGQGLRGKDLETELQISTHELAALRKALKRQAAKLSASLDGALDEMDQAVPSQICD